LLFNIRVFVTSNIVSMYSACHCDVHIYCHNSKVPFGVNYPRVVIVPNLMTVEVKPNTNIFSIFTARRAGWYF